MADCSVKTQREAGYTQVEITIKVDGQSAKTHIQETQGTLAQMEETIHALGKRVAHEALQACVASVPGPRPLFRKRADGCDTADTSHGR